MPVVDASVWVSIHLGSDPEHDRSLAWLRSALVGGDALYTPALALAELAAAVRRLTGQAELAVAAVRELLAIERLRLVALDAERAGKAAEIAAAAGLRGADAVYVAVARERGEFLVTFDREQRERGGVLVEVREP